MRSPKKAGAVEPPIKFFYWFVGQRVSRRDSDERGTIVETLPRLKVKWDGGRTSYFNRDESGNVTKVTA